MSNSKATSFYAILKFWVSKDWFCTSDECASMKLLVMKKIFWKIKLSFKREIMEIFKHFQNYCAFKGLTTYVRIRPKEGFLVGALIITWDDFRRKKWLRCMVDLPLLAKEKRRKVISSRGRFWSTKKLFIWKIYLASLACVNNE